MLGLKLNHVSKGATGKNNMNRVNIHIVKCYIIRQVYTMWSFYHIDDLSNMLTIDTGG